MSNTFSNVGTPPDISTLPQNPTPIEYGGFSGLNTKASQTGIEDQQMFVCDGLMPLGPNNLRTLYDIGAAIYTTTGGTTIESFGFGNFGDTAFALISLSDGSVVEVDTSTLAQTTVAAPGTITSFPPAFSQWGDAYSIFVSPQTNGYFLWDGTSLYKAGTLGPVVTVINGGKNYTGAPTISMVSAGAQATGYVSFASNPSPGDTCTLNGSAWTFVASVTGANQTPIGGTLGFTLNVFRNNLNASTDPLLTVATYATSGGGPVHLDVTYDTNGTIGNAYTLAASAGTPSAATLTGGLNGGGGATFLGTVENGSLVTVTVTNPGSGWSVNDEPPVLTITGGGSDDSARGTPVVSTDSGVQFAVVTNGGSGYSSLIQIAASGGSATVQATFAAVGQNGVITQIVVQNPGLGYQSVPTLTITDVASGAVGTGATAVAILKAGQIASVSVDGAGTGYTSPPTCTIIGDGIGAQVYATLSANTIGAFVVSSGGYGYTQAQLQLNGGNDSAAATTVLMPFGVSGTTVETFESRVWVGNGRVGQVSAASDPSDFSALDGATAFSSTDSFLKVAYHKFLQSNGFLYLVGDSSMNYISGVTTSGSPAITTFNNLNVDPQIGSPWPDTVQLFGRDIVFANPIGVYVSYGGAVTKVSDALDGIYTSVPQSSWPAGFEPSAAVMTIFGIQVYILLMPIIDQVSKSQVIKCLMWDGKKWWTSPQTGITNGFIASQEINSVLTAWCTPDKTTLKPMFNVASANLTKYLYSKLWSNPGVFITKVAREFFALLQVNQSGLGTQASGSVSFASNPSPGDTCTLNGVVWTFVASGATGNQINIGGTLGFTINVFRNTLNASVNPLLDVATYSTSGVGPVSLNVSYDAVGAAGNAYTLAASAATPSGPTLTGGTNSAAINFQALTENGSGTQVSFQATALGVVVVGPLPVADAGKVIGVRMDTTSPDMQLNSITPFNQLFQSNV